MPAQEGEQFSTAIGARFMRFSGRTGHGLDDAFARQIATDGLLDLAGVNYRGPSKPLHANSALKVRYLHLRALWEKVKNLFREPSQ